ncbi:FAD/NAD(P)-binding domain-containing protein [Aureobasidium sp. EXF-8845]|nr:FAD/NAD(P)-binding domain-containing protein [Aureobasidium sp. EXF-8845]KAI4858451.1 FAD/NAD(P)-binding domain-containing protein [Aureobasidium sp. EXF-8846]
MSPGRVWIRSPRPFACPGREASHKLLNEETRSLPKLLAYYPQILDQLGCREALYACVEPILWVYDRDKHGRLMAKASGVSQLMKARSGYSFAFTDRQDVLGVLYNNLKDKSKILLGKNLPQFAIMRVMLQSFVKIVLPLECQYRCLYGIASSSSGLASGEIDIGYNDKRSTVAIVGKNDRTYYFAFEKLDKTYKSPHIPTYTEANKDEYVKRHGSMKITDKILLRDLHKNSVSRFGGNQAIESAAALANSIRKLSDRSNGQRPTQEQIIACLQDYQKSREVRAAAAVEISNFITHVQALATWDHSLFARYGMKFAGDFLENMTSDGTVGAIRIDYLSLPKLSLQGNMPFNPEQGEGNKENLFMRALLASPFLVIFAFAWMLLSPALLADTGTSNNSAWFGIVFPPSSLTRSILGVESNTNRLGSVYKTSSPALDSAAGVRTANFLAYFGVVLAIWSIEAVRSCNALMPVQLPALFALFAQQKGLGVAAALYTVGIPTVICTVIWLRALLTSNSPISQIFLPGHISTSLTDYSISASDILSYNYIFAIASSYLWLLYFTWDAKVAGMVSQNWFTVLFVMALGTVVLGPSSVLGAGFLWREFVITERRHWGALTEERVREKEMDKVD